MKRFWYFFEEKKNYEVSETKLMVNSKKLDVTGIKSLIEKIHGDNLEEIIDCGLGDYYIVMKGTSAEDIVELVKKMSENEDVVYASLVFLSRGGMETLSYTNRISVGLKLREDYHILLKCAENHKINAVKVSEHDDLLCILTLPHNPQKDVIDTANELHETGLFEYAEPDTTTLFPLGTADTYFNNLWGLKDASNFSIKAESAWSITTGSTSIKVAVLDTGVSLNHIDLVGNLTSGFDATGNNTGGAPIILAGTDYAHGTKCAGVIAAKANNSKGIVGVAYNCKVMPVTVGTTMSMPGQQVAAGINWAVNNGADVISMSIRTDDINSIVTNAINNAVSNGRNKKGCILVACAHNDGTTPSHTVTFPASSTKVIAVGAMTQSGQRRSDSNYDNNLDIVAPGDDIYTTFILGSYVDDPNKVINNGTNDVYYKAFCCTSAATPHVAATAALILSVNPNLTQVQVRKAIESGCTKINPTKYPYSNQSGHPNGTWNIQVGHGCVNAFNSVLLAQTYYIGRNYSDTGGSYSMRASGGYAGISLYAFPQMSSGLTYAWSATWTGQCDRWYIWPNGRMADLSVYLNSGHSGGTLRINCEISVGGVLASSLYYYLEILP